MRGRDDYAGYVGNADAYRLGGNLTNSGRSTRLAFQKETPEYARNWWRFETGAHYTLSLKGTF